MLHHHLFYEEKTLFNNIWICQRKLKVLICINSSNISGDTRSFTQNDIYNSINFVAKQNKLLPDDVTINQIVDTWIDQELLPFVTVTRDYENGTVEFSQV